jgi:serine/threonine protein kinase
MSDEFGRYRLEAKIGEGGLAEVYRATTADGITSALKRLSRAHLGNEELTSVFANEARVATEMKHPRLLGAIDSGEVGGWPFLVMPLAARGSLGEKIREGRGLDRALLAPLAADLGDALSALHDHGYVHGDLSPGNVLFDTNDGALLGDFSACTAIGTRQTQTQGTFSYMSPEQVRGQAMDTRADVFSLATLLWECTSGQKIFWREAQHLCFMAVVDAEPPAMPAEFKAVEEVLRGALAKETEVRTLSLRELCEAFADAV